jgi:cytochrome c peroxidase
VNASRTRVGGLLLHFDGEFASLEDLVEGTIAGRNYGWRPGERAAAVAHAARVLREDDGSGDLAREFGGAYRDVLRAAPGVPSDLLLPPAFRLDVDAASDDALFAAVARLVAVYVGQLEFARDAKGRYAGSPYDAFLVRNRLPRGPARGESSAAYTRRLRGALARLQSPAFVDDGPFAFHERRRTFGPEELAGLRIFLASPGATASSRDLAAGGFGGCAGCHPAPDFTDFGLHDTGVTQVAYDRAHGTGAFAALAVPELEERRRDPERWLPATEAHPQAQEPFRRPVDPARPEHADLGVWNVFANPDFPAPQGALRRALCRAVREGARASGPSRGRCGEARLLRASLARFKTPGLRDLSHAGPYLHTGGFDALEDVVRFYRDVSDLARAGALRNGDAALARIALVDADVAPLTAFLRSLDEDYE